MELVPTVGNSRKKRIEDGSQETSRSNFDAHTKKVLKPQDFRTISYISPTTSYGFEGISRVARRGDQRISNAPIICEGRTAVLL